MAHKTTRLYIDVNYDPRKTDPESLSNGLDILMDTAMSTPGILDEYGNPRPLAFFVLNEEAPAGDNFKFTGALRDQSGASGEMKLTAELKGGQLVISLEGLGDKGTAPGYGAPILVEIWKGEPRVIVWSDINQEDPTHTISLAGAAETCREDADPVDPSNGVPCFPAGPPDTRTIILPCYGIVITLGEPDHEHPGTYLGGTITSEMHEGELCPDPGTVSNTRWDRLHGAMDALESIILAHANAGIDIAAPAYVEGIETAVEACGNHL